MQINQQKLIARRRVTGQGMTEYIIIVAMIALAAIAAVGAFGGVVKDSFVQMSNGLAGETATAVTVEDNTDTGATDLQTYTGN